MIARSDLEHLSNLRPSAFRHERLNLRLARGSSASKPGAVPVRIRCLVDG